MAPGQGKSTQAQREVVDRLMSGEVRRVLWAVRETNKATSLGRQALADFKKRTAGTDIQCDLVLGREASRNDELSEADYAQTMAWPETPCIKVISHAHLPLLMDPGLRIAGLADADLLVIDEDPSDSLLEHHAFALDALARHQHPSDRITPVLLSCSTQEAAVAQGAAIHEYWSFDKWKGADTWYGPTFWSALLAALGPLSSADIDAFLETLAACPPAQKDKPMLLRGQQLDAIRDALTEDHVSRNPSGRFALCWGEQGVTLDVYVRTPWQLNMPALVLDAYAANEKYTPLFQERRVAVLDAGDAAGPPQLHSMGSALARLDATNFRNGRQPDLPRRCLLEIRAYRDAQPDPRPTLLVGHKEIIEDESFITLGQSIFAEGWGTLVETQHWHAGRGKNDFRGYDIFALTRPMISKRHRDFRMAALAPHDPDLRQRLYQMDSDSEFLQTMHRNRQSHFPAECRPINVLFFDHPDAEPYTPHLHHTRGSTRPDWRDHATDVLVAFRDRLRGLPHAALHLAGLVRPEKSRSIKTPADLARGIREVLEDAGLDKLSAKSMSEKAATKALAPLLAELGLVGAEIAPVAGVRGQSKMKYYVSGAASDPKETAKAIETALRHYGAPHPPQAECAATDPERAAASSGARSRTATSAANISDQQADSGGPS